MNEKSVTCSKCKSLLSEEVRFCSHCGKRVGVKARGYYLTALSVAIAFGLGGWGLQRGVQDGRERPKSHPKMAKQVESQKLKESPQLVAMRQEVRESPEDMQKLKMFAGMLGDQLRSNPQAPSGLVFEAIEVFGRILEKDPKDSLALVLMADVSFDQKAFTKALDFYARYLAVEPDDLGARARYASTLTFLGRYDESVVELEKVLQVDPKNFPAKAYLAITYAQKGEVATAREIGGQVLKIAPSEEARARFASFVETLASSQQSESKQVANAIQDRGQKPLSGLKGFVADVRANPVAGRKLVRHSEKGESTIVLFFNDFPMDKMPPFAKQKFFSRLRDSLTKNGLNHIKRIEFLDSSTGSELDVLLIAG